MNFVVTVTENITARVATLIDDGAVPAHISIQQPPRQQLQATTTGITNATTSKRLPTLLPPVDDNYGHAADPTARTSASTVCTELQERISTTTCSALAAASGSSAASAALWSFAAGRTGRRSGSNSLACCAADDDDRAVLHSCADSAAANLGMALACTQHRVDLHLFRKSLNPQ